MIYLYSGTPGSGKTLHAAKEIYDSLKYKKRPVIANFHINEETKGIQNFTYLPNHEITPDQLYKFAYEYWGDKRVKEDTILLVLDEAQLVFNSRNWSQKNRIDWIEFFSQQRHFVYKIIIIAQNNRILDRQIRAKIEMEVKHRKLANFGLKGKLLSLPFLGRLFAAVQYYYGLNEQVGVNWFVPRKKYLRLYNSYNHFKQAPDRA